MKSQCLCRCVVYLVHVWFFLNFMEGFSVAWKPSLLQKCILKSFRKMTYLNVQYVH